MNKSLHPFLLLILTVNLWTWIDAHTLEINGLEEVKEVYRDFRKVSNGNKISPEFKIKPVETPLHVGSYNVQTLGKKKILNDFIMDNLVKVIHRYDLILITEIMTNDKYLINRFMHTVNRFAPDGVTYNFVMNNSTVNEYYAFLYRIDKLRVIKQDSYKDTSRFYRYPFFVLFDSPTLRDMKRFGVIGHHVKPNYAVREISALADAYDFMKDKYKIEDILLMGDFNAQCSYIKENDWENISLWTREEFTWAIDHNVDTTTNYRSCALDRFVYAGENMNSGVILSSAKALNLQEEFGFSLQQTRDLSDHKPIELKIRGRMNDISEKHLTSESCFNIVDSRNINVSTPDFIKIGQRANYTVISQTLNITLLMKETRSFNELTYALKNLKRANPNIFTPELLEAVMYKLENGALNDLSSFADDEQSDSFRIKYKISRNTSKITICKKTAIN